MRTYYRTDQVDLVISCHPDADYVGGLQEVLGRLKVRDAVDRPWSHTRDIVELFKSGCVSDQAIRE